MTHKRYLTADEAVAALGVSKATLYSYVSRGLVRSEETGDKRRTRRYRAEDVAALQQRKEQRRNPAQAAATALHFGDPVLESAITLIADGQLYYRGQSALTLARQQHFETVTELLWGHAKAGAALVWEGWPLPSLDAQVMAMAAAQVAQGNPAAACQLALIAAATTDVAAYNQSPAAVMQTGVRILRLLTHVLTQAEHPGSIAQQLQQAWQSATPAATAIFDSALILCADHELNVSSFTARCVASASATPYAAVVAALSAFQGSRHGGAGERVAAFFQEAQHDPQRAVLRRLRHGETVPGFGHLLYPAGDPRGKLLLELARQHAPGAAIWPVVDGISEAMQQAAQLAPNLDFGLVTLAQALALPAVAPFTLFAIGRTAGWIGHILEQYQSDRIIRPRARYHGVQPIDLQSS
ncbi:MAG: citrate synthase family protein [Caldilineaceae bacterium]